MSSPSADTKAAAAAEPGAAGNITEWRESLLAAAHGYHERDGLEGRTDIGGLVDQTVVMDAETLKGQKVVIFKHCAGCTIEMPKSVGYRVIKVSHFYCIVGAVVP
jgi:hypothetical protein